MANILTDYKGGYRQALIIKNPDGELGKTEGEKLLILKDQLIFLSDYYSVPLDEKNKAMFLNMQEGDIVEINDKGVVFQTFFIEDSDACIFMTGNCNSNCIMCPSSDKERSIDFGNRREDIFQYISMLPADLRNYVVTGGEPTLNPDLFLEVMGVMAERFQQAEALLLTNGRSFSVLSFLEKMMVKCPPFLTVAIPLHGSNAELHDYITQAKGSFTQTLQGIKNLLNKKVSVEIRIVVTNVNKDNITEICEMISKTFPSCLRVNFISLEVRGNCYKNCDEVYIEPRESFLKSKDGIRTLIKNGINVGLYNYPLCCIDPGFRFLCRKSISREKVVYAPECNECKLREFCGGIFVSTLNVKKPELYPG